MNHPIYPCSNFLESTVQPLVVVASHISVTGPAISGPSAARGVGHRSNNVTQPKPGKPAHGIWQLERATTRPYVGYMHFRSSRLEVGPFLASPAAVCRPCDAIHGKAHAKGSR